MIKQIGVGCIVLLGAAACGQMQGTSSPAPAPAPVATPAPPPPPPPAPVPPPPPPPVTKAGPATKSGTEKKGVAEKKSAAATPTPAPVAPPAPAPAPAPAAAAAPAAKGGAREGLSAAGEVTDPTKLSCGDGPKVKGMNDTEGEIIGKLAPGSKFNQLQIGMGMKQVTDIAGAPTDQGAYITGKAFIPWYFGSDRHRFEMAYKGWGRLIFAGGSLGNYSGGNLICVINFAADTGYR